MEMKHIAISFLILAGLVISFLVSAQQDEGNIKQLTAIAKKPSVIYPNDTPRLGFDFGDFEATLNKKGKMTVKGWVSHSRLRCGNYSVGLRFGQGEHGCTNVKWLTEAKYLTHKTQCNKAKLEHDGFEIGEKESLVFDKVSCGQLLIRCSGACN